jgi:hypothetical protein
MRRSGSWLASRGFDGGALFLGFRLVIEGCRKQRKLDRVDQGTEELPGCRDVVVLNVIQKDMQFVADYTCFGFWHGFKP